MVKINTLNFDSSASEEAKKIKYGSNWPVVYIINNNTEAYIGETTNFSSRTNQHLSNEKRRSLDKINIIADKTFNKSVALDLESFLIKYMAADKLFELQNGNGGLQNHNYYQKETYEEKFKDIWNQLKTKGLVKNELIKIENSDLFKYSPYKSLSEDQYMVVDDIISNLSDIISTNETSTFVVNGGPGTGKTILGIYLIKLLNDMKIRDSYEIEDNDTNHDYSLHLSKYTIAMVIPMDNLRKTLKKVFRNIKGLSNHIVLSPNDVAKSDVIYDLLIVDEAHRLRKRKNLTNYKSFDDNNKKFNLGTDGTELDWILLKSKSQIFFYDEKQSIKPSDVDPMSFNQLMMRKNYQEYPLRLQLRCLKGGNEYIHYMKQLFSNEPPMGKIIFKEYDLKLFDDVFEMTQDIKEKNKTHELCRNIAGFSWKWKTKGTTINHLMSDEEHYKMIENGCYDIEIDGHKFIWNTTAADWINSKNSINEIGSIHTTQGFDLNYTGLIIGNELKFDPQSKKIMVDRKEYYDTKGKSSTDDEELLEYLFNVYVTMCTRGILGTYIYVCDEHLREYFRQYIEVK